MHGRESEMRESSIVKRLLSIMLVVVMLITGSACKKDEPNREYEKKRQELYNEKQALIDERFLLIQNLDKILGNRAYMSFVFIGIDAGLYEDVLPIFEDGDVKLTGVMALSENELPGMDGKITVSQYRELVEHGWETTLYWNKTASDVGEIMSFLDNMKSELSELGIDFPKSIVFEEGTYTVIYDGLLSGYGIETVMHDGNNDFGIIASEKPEGTWHAGIIGWRDLLRSTRLKNAIENNEGYAAFKISFDNIEENYATSFYPIDGESTANGIRTDVFIRMINNFKKSVRNGNIHVEGIEGSRQKIIDYFDDEVKYRAEVDARVEEIDILIEDVDRRISELYDEYY